MKLLIVADAGGWKTDWVVYSPALDIPLYFTTKGINASVMKAEEISAAIEDFKRQLSEKLGSHFIDSLKEKKLYFYGAGCNSSETVSRIAEAIDSIFSDFFTSKEFGSDILGAGRALFNNEPGIIAIMGTGSASAIYDGEEITDSIPSLGFMIGDEGSGAYFGKEFLNCYFKRGFSQDLNELINDTYHLSIPEVIRKIYREPSPNTYLASFLPFISENRHYPELLEIINNGINQFFIRNINKYDSTEGMRIGFIGSVAFSFSDIVGNIALKHNRKVYKILRHPIDDLLKYHIAKSL